MTIHHLDVAGQPVLLALPGAPAAARPAPAPADQPALPGVPAAPEPASTPGAGSGDQLATTVFRTLLEVLQGRRPLAQLAGSLDEEAAARLAAWGRRRDWRGTTLVSVRSCPTDAQVVEASAHLADGARHLAAAVRLERRDGRWIVTHLEVVAPATVAQRAA